MSMRAQRRGGLPAALAHYPVSVQGDGADADKGFGLVVRCSQFSAVCCLLSIFCCLISAVCCLLTIVYCLLPHVCCPFCCLLYIVYCVLPPVCFLLSAVFCLLSIACCLLSAFCCLPAALEGSNGIRALGSWSDHEQHLNQLARTSNKQQRTGDAHTTSHQHHILLYAHTQLIVKAGILAQNFRQSATSHRERWCWQRRQSYG
jgi:hypothetical protein